MNHGEIALRTAQAAPVTVLGHRIKRIPTGGKIHAGIQILTPDAAKHRDIVAIYEQGVAQNISFQKISHRILEQFPQIKKPLMPKNVPWFTVRPEDFPNRDIPGQIMHLYGEDRGEGRRLYRFPVIFPTDTWQLIVPHELATWSANEKRYWSEYSADGRTRHCMMFAPFKVEAGSKRIIRTFGGRAKQLRPDNHGICDPECCPQFQARQCNLSGRFVFYIPGVQSIDAFELATNSIYAMSRAIERLETVSYMREGKISGYLDSNRSTFYITKMLRDVSRIGDDGRSVKTAHWIIELQAPIDVALLLRNQNDGEALRMTDTSVVLLNGTDTAEFKQVSTVGDERGELPDSSVQMPEKGDDIGAGTLHTAMSNTGMGEGSTEPTDLDAIWMLLGEMGIDRSDFERYAAKKWGSGWHINPRGRIRVYAELRRHENHPEGLKDQIEAVIGLV
ncbi:hypothetical protein [Janthinobacterium lividum]|uniref:recombination directionality factor n=1 Tax=Janthinobacterium lividum TaxID=29581 RepID=UPI00159582ED|nr:hypothetical protein [Janthinobacterium lividum]QKY11994.1 hypothetical protein G8765_29320 [Janthinobacterium lividum]